MGLKQIRHLLLDLFQAFFFGLSRRLYEFCDLEYILLTYRNMFNFIFFRRVIYRLSLLDPNNSLIICWTLARIDDPYLIWLRNHDPSLLVQPLFVLSFENERHIAGTAVQIVIKGGLLIIVVVDDEAIIDEILVFFIVVIVGGGRQIIIDVLSMGISPLLLRV